ncbi:fatty-acid oxidation protein subunit alpha [Scytonema hofmannii PCC 7110]|uniref:Fatty-acid oxidation protein subunit alpha n=1 Tax=Scytonema hofmannii PCC 7110 TaxID=128403 RepID=A0A139X6N1_9CYAN|nr:element excision factor XisH family protein [Scytonema hofmannii]KYC40293.1 fatty-acid oxidation protein subunit alpha [Scytonema hofmannii PCC 7110]
MSAKDRFHNLVKSALIRDGWTITHELFPIDYGDVQMQIDLGAERLVAAERGSEKIAVEVKSFIAPSTISEFHTALGQFLNYRSALRAIEPERILYLAVPLQTYEEFFRLRFIQEVTQEHRLNLLIYDVEKEGIVQWIKLNSTAK